MFHNSQQYFNITSITKDLLQVAVEETFRKCASASGDIEKIIDIMQNFQNSLKEHHNASKEQRNHLKEQEIDVDNSQLPFSLLNKQSKLGTIRLPTAQVCFFN